MKRFVFFLSLLLTCFVGVESAWAQTFRVSDAPSNGQWGEHTYWYYIQNQDGKGWLGVNHTTNGYLNLTATECSESEEEQWCLVGSETDGYVFYNKASGTSKVLGITNLNGTNENTNNYGASRASMVDYDGTTESSTADNEVGFLFIRLNASLKTGGTYDAFKLSGTSGDTQRHMNQRDGYLAYWATSETNGLQVEGSSFKFVAVNNFEEALYKTNLLINSLDKTSLDNPFYYTSASYNNLNSVYNQYKSYNETSIGNEKNTAIEALNNAMNLEIAELKDGDRLLLRNYSKTTTYVGCNGSKLTQNTQKASYPNIFTFKKQSDGKWKIYNEYYDMYVGAVPTAANTGFPMVSGEENATSYTIESSILGTANISDKTVNNKFWDQSGCNGFHMGDAQYGIVVWETSANAKASQFYFMRNDIDQVMNDIDAALIEQSNTAKYIGYATPTEEVINATNAFKSSTTENHLSNYKALETAIANNNNSIIKPEVGKYYTIESAAFSGKYITESYTQKQGDNNQLMSASYGNNIMPALWQFEPVTDEGKTDLYYIKAANSGNCMSKIAWGYKPMRVVAKSDTNVGQLDIFDKTHVSMPLSVTIVSYTDDDRSDRGTACINRGSQNGDGDIESWNSNDYKNNNFRILEVTAIPVSISNAGYATINLPMAVTIPSGVKAYTGQKDGNVINLAEITTGVIPAETPVILEANEGQYNFNIDYNNTDSKPENGLSGTLMPTTIANDATAYVLGNGSQGIAFYRINSTTDRTIGANKAYATTTDAASNALVFNFGGTTTGINNAVNNETESNIYYDLNGRRVLYPTQGIFVKANGQKVFIK